MRLIPQHDSAAEQRGRPLASDVAPGALRALGRQIVPDRLRHRMLGAVRSVRYRGSEVYCVCCDGSFARFIAHNERPHAKCPRCGALERHRLLLLFLRDRSDLMQRQVSLLHVAPEQAVARHLTALPNIRYRSVDLDSAYAMDRADIHELPYPDGSFDVVICNHVLEHVADDRRALTELHRVLSAGGHAILMSPIDEKLSETIDDPDVTTAAERQRVFGQPDHVRRYGRDFGDRVAETGFEVTCVSHLEDVDPDEVRRQGLARESDLFARDDIFVCAKQRVASPVSA